MRRQIRWKVRATSHNWALPNIIAIAMLLISRKLHLQSFSFLLFCDNLQKAWTASKTMTRPHKNFKEHKTQQDNMSWVLATQLLVPCRRQRESVKWFLVFFDGPTMGPRGPSQGRSVLEANRLHRIEFWSLLGGRHSGLVRKTKGQDNQDEERGAWLLGLAFWLGLLAWPSWAWACWRRFVSLI